VRPTPVGHPEHQAEDGLFVADLETRDEAEGAFGGEEESLSRVGDRAASTEGVFELGDSFRAEPLLDVGEGRVFDSGAERVSKCGSEEAPPDTILSLDEPWLPPRAALVGSSLVIATSERPSARRRRFRSTTDAVELTWPDVRR
jgi:hypothetical protein